MSSIIARSSTSVDDIPLQNISNGLATRNAHLEDREGSSTIGKPPVITERAGWLFGKECLDRSLKRHHITSISIEDDGEYSD